jgi:ADP-ribose pyrophosphatase YjhB (NUDIX family)
MLTEPEGDQLAKLLNKMGLHMTEAGRLPLNVFRALWENTVMPGVDLAVIDSMLRILLHLRPEGDPFAGLWHIPGTRVLKGDDALSSLKKRVMERDFGFVLPREPGFLAVRDIMEGPSGPNTSPVGQEIYRSYVYFLQGDDPEIQTSEDMQFFPLDGIPEEFMQHQLPTIELLRATYCA